jgi:hypothetical protein
MVILPVREIVNVRIGVGIRILRGRKERFALLMKMNIPIRFEDCCPSGGIGIREPDVR